MTEHDVDALDRGTSEFDFEELREDFAEWHNFAWPCASCC